MIKVVNDVALVEIEKNLYEVSGMKLVGGEQKKSIGTGILKELPKLPYLGFHAFAFDKSLSDPTVLKDIYDYYKVLIGKRVYWTALSERGMVFTKGDQAFALIKLTDLVGYSEPDEVWEAEIAEIKF